MVKTTKHTLEKVFGQGRMDLDIFTTALAEISNIINNRPLVLIEGDSYPLTPNQLLKGGFCNQQYIDTPDEPDVLNKEKSHLFKREFARRRLVKDWWTEFNQLYLKDLTRFHVDIKGVPKGVKTGQIVLVHKEKVNRLDWKLAQIVEMVKSKDGLYRKAKIEMLDKGNKRIATDRAIKNLYPIEIHPGIIDADYAKEEDEDLPFDSITCTGKILNKSSMGGVLNNSTPEQAVQVPPKNRENTVRERSTDRDKIRPRLRSNSGTWTVENQDSTVREKVGGRKRANSEPRRKKTGDTAPDKTGETVQRKRLDTASKQKAIGDPAPKRVSQRQEPQSRDNNKRPDKGKRMAGTATQIDSDPNSTESDDDDSTSEDSDEISA
jgi:hypothetical protein